MSAEPTHISQRQLRNDSGAVLRAVEAGETFVITNHGRPVARLLPVPLPVPAPLVAPENPTIRFSALVRHRGTSGRSSGEILREMRGDR